MSDLLFQMNRGRVTPTSVKRGTGSNYRQNVHGSKILRVQNLYCTCKTCTTRPGYDYIVSLKTLHGSKLYKHKTSTNTNCFDEFQSENFGLVQVGATTKLASVYGSLRIMFRSRGTSSGNMSFWWQGWKLSNTAFFSNRRGFGVGGF